MHSTPLYEDDVWTRTGGPTARRQPPATNTIANGQNGCSTLAAGRVGCTPCWAAACGTSALPADLSPNLQSTSRSRIRLSVANSLTAFIRLHAVLGARLDAQPRE